MAEKYLELKIAVGISIFMSGALSGIALCYYKENIVPSANRVQQGYAVPNKLEIKLQDLDGNGEKETILKYENKDYLLKISKDGKPIIDYK